MSACISSPSRLAWFNSAEYSSSNCDISTGVGPPGIAFGCLSVTGVWPPGIAFGCLSVTGVWPPAVGHGEGSVLPAALPADIVRIHGTRTATKAESLLAAQTHKTTVRCKHVQHIHTCTHIHIYIYIYMYTYTARGVKTLPPRRSQNFGAAESKLYHPRNQNLTACSLVLGKGP